MTIGGTSIPRERIGSSKMMIAREPGILRQKDLGLTSIFDRGVIPGFQSMPLARARTTQTACALTWLEKDEFRTHWSDLQKWPESEDLIVHEAQVDNLPLLSGHTELDVIELELLFRVRASEKFRKRVAKGKVTLPSDVWPAGKTLQTGDRFLRPFVEASTKWEAVDRYLTPAEAGQYVALNIERLTALYQWVSAVGQSLDSLYASTCATLIDGKLEVALCRKTGEFVIIDGISLDELGVWYNGEQYGKNPLRDWYKTNHPKWYAALEGAQEKYPDDPNQWPEYPPLDADVAATHVAKNSLMASQLQGVLHSSS